MLSQRVFALTVWGVMAMSVGTTAATLPDFDAWWDFDAAKQTEAKFREVLPTAQASGNRGYHAELLTQIARTQGLQQLFAEAHGTLNQAESLLPKGASRAHVRYLLERGRVFNSSGQKDKAKPLFVAAWDEARQVKQDRLAVDAAHMIAIVETPEQALAWNERAVALAEASADPAARKWLGSLYNNIGWTYHDQKAYEKALGYFEKALVCREKEQTPSEILVAKWCVARTLRSLGRISQALTMQQALAEAHERAKTSDGYVFEELAECLTALGRNAEAKPYFAKAYTELAQDTWLVKQEPERVNRLKVLGAAP